MSLGLDSVVRLLAALGHPEKNLKCLHVAGTNGKGSVSAIAESLLRASGLRTGLYTSPHLVDFKERIRLQGECIDEVTLDEGIRHLQEATKGWERLPTFFELTTALALSIFAQKECDVVVLETGLGGRLDATNLAPKVACAITPIDLDHTEWLGPTLRDIAREKAGIMRAGVPVVSAPQSPEVLEVLREEVERVGAPLDIITEPISTAIPLGLVGSYQRWNAALALALVDRGGFKISSEAKKDGLATVSWPGRFQRLSLDNQILILDGAHNPAAVHQLLQTWKEEYPNQKYELIFGSLADKEGETMLKLLEPLAAEIFLVPISSPRSNNPRELLPLVPKAKIFTSLEAFLDRKRKQKGLNNTPILLTGSLFLVGEALALLEGRVYRPSKQ
ncbi:MAG: hypothetical protein A3F67_07960 [Verrucomicrobia bacterium RIFCSPHIGHO2_12_FULL_41_10]|nr:MAG: hypothetical protein A3F67_07960 [Verrucomicrobia bacterium RIFCSPHIGHO2_12_FULL_41_10]